MLFPTEKQEGSCKGAWNHQPCNIHHTFTGSPETAEKISFPQSCRRRGSSRTRGKKPKEREKYVIRLGDGKLVEVNREIYLEWYRSERRERYQKERDRKYGLCSIDKLHEKGYFPEQSIFASDTTQETVLRNEYQSRLQNALKNLPERDTRLIKLLYFEEITVKKAADIFSCSRKTIQNRRKQILEKIRKMMEDI